MRFFLIFAIPVALFLYSPALQSPLYLDDGSTLVQSDSLSPVTAASFVKPGRASTELSLWTSHRFANLFSATFHWRRPFYFRIVALLMHILSATLLAGLVFELCGEWIRAVIAGTLFLVHPIQSEAVIYIAQRSEVQAALFMIASTLCYVQFRRNPSKRLLVCLAVLCCAAISSKENAVIVLPWLALIELIFFFDRRNLRWIVYGLPAGVALALFGLNMFLSRAISRTFMSWPQYVLSKGAVLETYLRLFVFPRQQFLLYDFPAATHLSFKLAAQWTLALGLLLLGVILLRKRPLTGFGIISFFVLLAPDILVPRGDLIFEYRVYPAFAGIAISVASLPKMNNKSWICLFAVLALALGYRTEQRCEEWTDSLRFLEMHKDRFPTNPRILANLGFEYMENGMYNKALAVTQEARRYESRLNDYYRNQVALVIATNLGYLYLTVGNIQQAKTEAMHALGLNNREPSAFWLMGEVQRLSGDYGAARQAYLKLLKLDPANIDAWRRLREVMLRTSNTDLAQIAENRIRKELQRGEQQKVARLSIPKEYASLVIFGCAMLILAAIYLWFKTVWAMVPMIKPLLQIPPRGGTSAKC